MNPSPDEGQVFLDYQTGTGPTFNSLSSTAAGSPGVTSVQSGTELTASDNINVVNNSDGSETINWFAPVVATLPVANLPLVQTQAIVVWWTGGSPGPGLYIYLPSAAGWTRIGP
jgi:hypothetical protein